MIIYKYPIKLTEFQKVPLPVNAEILTVQVQDRNLCLWAQFDERNITIEERSIEICGTGQPMSNTTNREYIGTVQEGGVFVWHVFEITNQ